jgi:NADH-quinone oxidoreductase E subunit
MMDNGLEEVCAFYKERNDLLSLFKEVQKRNGYLSAEVISDIASLWGVPPEDVYGVATFYPLLSTKPTGQNVVRICKSLPCLLKNGETIIDTLCTELGIAPGETTKDGQFSLELVNCIGACDSAPAMMVNDEVYGNLTPEKVKEVVRNIKNQLSNLPPSN